MKKKCINCGSHYAIKTKWSKNRRKNSKFCSVECYRNGITTSMRQAMAENARRNIAKETPEQRKSRMAKTIESRNKNGIWVSPGLGRIKDKNYAWKGDKANYNSKHRWIQKHWTKTGTCVKCKITPEPFGNRKYGTEWANISGDYNREDRTDWLELCVGCHRKLDA